MKKSFTLPEITVVLVVVGILAAILLPMSKNIIPNANLIKFHKAHTALYNAISELTTSDKYYLGGDLGIKADGTILNGTRAEKWLEKITK